VCCFDQIRVVCVDFRKYCFGWNEHNRDVCGYVVDNVFFGDVFDIFLYVLFELRFSILPS